MGAQIEVDLGPIDTLIYNAGNGVWKNYDKITEQEFDSCIATNARGLLTAAQLICPKMVKNGSGTVAVTGATASWRDGGVDKNEAPGAEQPGRLDPNAIAETYWNLAQQPKSCWTFELDVRPSVENW